MIMFNSAEDLREFIGHKKYIEIKEHFGGQRIYINNETKRFDNAYFKMATEERNALFFLDYKNGVRPRHLSEKYGLKISYVRRLLHLLKKKDVTHNEK